MIKAGTSWGQDNISNNSNKRPASKESPFPFAFPLND